MENREFPFDEIGIWSEIKHEIIKEYAKAYSTIMTQQKVIKKHAYIDAFAGGGIHVSKITGEYVDGSPLNALKVDPPFSEFHFIELNERKSENLHENCKDFENVKIYNEDCNKILLTEVFPKVKYENYNRALCLLDPYGLHLDWQVIEKAGSMKSIEIFLNFPVHDINRNALRQNPKKRTDNQTERMNKFWGDNSWQDIAYEPSNDLFSDTEKQKVKDYKTIGEKFRERLKEIAGFKYVPKPIPMRNSNNAVMYYLYFASQKDTGRKIVESIFKKYENHGKKCRKQK